MSITSVAEREGMEKVSEAVALTLKEMRNFARPGITTKQLDDFGKEVLSSYGARSAPFLTYGFPGWTCISVNNEVAHGIPSGRVMEVGDLINIDVSAELGGFWSDNGGSFILGEDLYQLQPLVTASKLILQKAINQISAGLKIAEVGRIIESEAKKRGYKVIENLAGHGIGRSLHEAPHHILNYYDKSNRERFKKHSVVAIETFISTRSDIAEQLEDGWTLVGNKGGHVVQHEHTILVTESRPVILTHMNGIWDAIEGIA